MDDQEILDIRSLSSAERAARLKAHKAMLAKRAEESESRWHVVDDPITPDQFRELPPGRAHGDTRTPELSLRFRHPQTRKVVCGPGYLDYDGGIWMAQLRPDYWGSVEVMAWEHSRV